MKHIKRVSLIIMVSLLLLAFCQPLMAEGEKININTASQQELMKLKHVGEKLAEKIIEYRKNNPFQKLEDIMKVQGVGEKIFNANKELMIIKNK